MNAEFAEAFRLVARNMTAVAESAYPASVEKATDLLVDTFNAGGKLLAFGNGGSSADAQHLTAELVGRFSADRRPLPAIALTANQAILTAWSNDYSFEDVFARQVEALGRPGDVALGISTSGNSANVLNALQRARGMGLKTIGLTGGAGGRMAEWSDVLLNAPVTGTARIQEVHLATYHAICAVLERRLVTP